MSSVCAQHLGIKPVNAGLYAQTLQQIKYRLKTLLGTSETYTNTKENPLYPSSSKENQCPLTPEFLLLHFSIPQ
jgi:hypothetical protein